MILLTSSYRSLRKRAFGLLRLSAVILAIATTLAVHAAEDRAIKTRVAPVYPEMARRMRLTGVVRISATVAPDGSVKSAKAVSGNQMLANAAEEAVQRWKFVPAADESVVEVNINFTLGQ